MGRPCFPVAGRELPGSRLMWFDSHCHLQGEADPGAAVVRARAAGVGRMVCVGTDAADSARAVELAVSLGVVAGTGPGGPGLWATVGLHPHHASEGVDGVERLLGSLVGGAPGHAGVVAVGECGLDYHYDYSPRPDQREAFAAQVVLARSYGLALVIHTREAWDDTFDVLDCEGLPERIVFHCFTGGPQEARRCLDRGAYLSFSGIVTFKGASDVREAAALCPSDRLLVETDSPYLAPVPHRGAPNQPALVPVVGAAVAAARGVDVCDVERSSAAAASEVFGLAPADRLL